MKKLLATLGAAVMMFGLLGVSQAQANPDPEGPAKKGLCTAYFNGQKKGHDKDGDGYTDNAGPFQALEQAGQEHDDRNGASDDDPNTNNDGEDLVGEKPIYSDVFEYCDGFIGGQPEHNGRYDCKEPGADGGRDADSDLEVECYPNDGSSGTDGDHPYDTGDDHPSKKK